MIILRHVCRIPPFSTKPMYLFFVGSVLFYPQNSWLASQLNRFITHRIHGAAIYGNIYHQYTPNVSIYTSTMDLMGLWSEKEQNMMPI